MFCCLELIILEPSFNALLLKVNLVIKINNNTIALLDHVAILVKVNNDANSLSVFDI